MGSRISKFQTCRDFGCANKQPNPLHAIQLAHARECRFILHTHAHYYITITLYLADGTTAEEPHVAARYFRVCPVVEYKAGIRAVKDAFEQFCMRVVVDKDAALVAVLQSRLFDAKAAVNKMQVSKAI